jgi:DNA-binding transcriptional regulator YiaG
MFDLLVDEVGDRLWVGWQPITGTPEAPFDKDAEVRTIALDGTRRIGSHAAIQQEFELVEILLQLPVTPMTIVSQNTSQWIWCQMLSAAQIRGARALLGISATELAETSGVDLRTIQRFESVIGVPKSRSGTLDRIKETLEEAGITFLGDPLTSPGVQLKRRASKARGAQ